MNKKEPRAKSKKKLQKSVYAIWVIDEISSSIFNKVNKALFFLELNGPLGTIKVTAVQKCSCKTNGFSSSERGSMARSVEQVPCLFVETVTCREPPSPFVILNEQTLSFWKNRRSLDDLDC
jgi:hypothetical protein